MPLNTNERREHNRVNYAVSAKLSDDAQSYTTQVVDVSLAGALVAEPNGWNGGVGDFYRLSFMMKGSDKKIAMGVKVAHKKDGFVGLSCEDIDLGSLANLRQLIQQHDGDQHMLERDLGSLSADE